MSFSTSSWFKRINSSCWTTSGKCFWLKTSAACIRSTQLCVSAKSRMPKQFDGSSWLSRNSQQACFTPTENWRGEWALHAYYQSTASERASGKKGLHNNENPTQITSFKYRKTHMQIFMWRDVKTLRSSPCVWAVLISACSIEMQKWNQSDTRKRLKCELHSASQITNENVHASGHSYQISRFSPVSFR